MESVILFSRAWTGFFGKQRCCTSFVLTTWSNFWLTKIDCTVISILKLRSFARLLITFADVSSFKGILF